MWILAVSSDILVTLGLVGLSILRLVSLPFGMAVHVSMMYLYIYTSQVTSHNAVWYLA